MSNQPPPAFGGHPNYAQQWPPPFPSAMPTDFPSNVDYHDVAQMPPLNPTQTLDANMASFYANSHLAGAASHAHPGLFFPPPLPYMNQFHPSQQPVAAFPPMPMQSLGNPQVPVPSGSSIAPPASGGARAVDANRPHETHRKSHDKSALVDRNREEGEISEEENGLPVASKKTRGTRRAKQRRASNQHSDLEEGETMSSISASSSRSSSPYNPSLPVAADPEVVSHAIEMQKRETTATFSKDTRGLVSAEQLRLRAQGALLSLKPHNISYDELVGEGLNPTILRQLYEQVGLKVASQAEKPVDIATNQATLSSKQTNSVAPQKIGDSRRKSSTAPPAPTPSAPSVTQPETGKPMERKEVIARMLAAKAAKSSTVPAKSAPEESQTTSTPPLSAAPGEPQSKQNVVTVREKNKAKTELARQRIEELKRQALLKSQQKSQLAQSNQGSQVHQPAVLPTPGAPAVQHPLPVRPPIPQPSEAASIPGLVMTGSKKDSGLQTPADASQAINVDSTPVSRATHRKRPRASDFDEPDAVSKRHLGYEKDPARLSDRLVIEFSDDDESLYGEDPDTMDVDSDQDQRQPTASITTLDTSRPVLQKYPSSSSTPQGSSWQSDNENMRQKDLEIQEMHRKIAELEERRKAKLAASRTESPRTVDDSLASYSLSSSSSAVQSSPVGADVAQSLPASATKPAEDTDKTMTALPRGSSLTDFFDKSSVGTLATMNIAQLESLRSAICGVNITETALPGLNAATSSSAMDIFPSKEDVISTLSNTPRDKEEYARLLEELQKLSHEIGGLSLDVLEELRQQAEIKQKHGVEEAASATSQASSDVKDQLISQAPSNLQPTTAVPSLTQKPEVDRTVNCTHDPIEASSSPHPESMSSAMDESADISNQSQDSSSEDEESEAVDGRQTLGFLPNSTQLQNEDSASMLESIGSSEDESSDSLDSDASSSDEESLVAPDNLDLDDSSHERTSPALNGEKVTVEDSVKMDTPSESFHRESSSESGSNESEAYEPPEPDTAAEPNSPYSPPFSPAPHVPVEDDQGNTFAALDGPPADELLTGAPQTAPSELHPPPQVETHGNNTSSTSVTSGSRFTPYISPLRHFKAYRYHPGFTEDVSNGFRSLTYSHDIDAMKYFCPYELAGGVCNDRSCEFQHFRDITLSDDKILIEMGSVREGQTEEEKETYLAGLKEIINEMRRDKVKDFSTVASEIVAYRRRFLQDPSRVLPL